MLAVAAATAMTGWLHYNESGGEALEELHDVLANAWLVLVAVHVAGVIVGSLAHRRNLVATMTTGGGPLLAGAERTAGERGDTGHLEHGSGAALSREHDDEDDD